MLGNCLWIKLNISVFWPVRVDAWIYAAAAEAK